MEPTKEKSGKRSGKSNKTLIGLLRVPGGGSSSSNPSSPSNEATVTLSGSPGIAKPESASIIEDQLKELTHLKERIQDTDETITRLEECERQSQRLKQMISNESAIIA